jgi:hypothetical protein
VRVDYKESELLLFPNLRPDIRGSEPLLLRILKLRLFILKVLGTLQILIPSSGRQIFLDILLCSTNRMKEGTMHILLHVR